jgi:glycerol-3-phosphate dehydrogenase
MDYERDVSEESVPKWKARGYSLLGPSPRHNNMMRMEHVGKKAEALRLKLARELAEAERAEELAQLALSVAKEQADEVRQADEELRKAEREVRHEAAKKKAAKASA